MTKYGQVSRGLVLACEGSLHPPGAALVSDGEIIGLAEQEGSGASRVGLFSLALRLLREQGAVAGDLSGIVVDTGPGSFTGVRVALGLARGLVLARPSLPVVGIDAPRVLARAAEVELPTAVAIPWGRLRVLLTRAREGGPLPEESLLVQRVDLAAHAKPGAGAVVCPSSLADAPWPAGTTLVECKFSATRALALLVSELALGQAGSFPEPVYLVAPDAVLPARAQRLPEGHELSALGSEALPEVAGLEGRAFDRPWSEAMLAEELSGGEERLALGVRDAEGRLLAYAFARHAPDALWILSVATEPAGRRRGLARALVRALLARAREADHPRVDLEVRVTNDAAIALYASEGFVPVGRRPRYYRDGTDALLMSSVLRR